jgi:hypothetical protein
MKLWAGESMSSGEKDVEEGESKKYLGGENFPLGWKSVYGDARECSVIAKKGGSHGNDEGS